MQGNFQAKGLPWDVTLESSLIKEHLRGKAGIPEKALGFKDRVSQ
ncbi:hypothetical protein [Desulfolucanica intricata]|nr:hypothetical protein [Desulfolucanica intricata]